MLIRCSRSWSKQKKLSDPNTLAASSNSGSNVRTDKRRRLRGRKMPCLDISTNVNLDGIDTDSLFSELTTAVSQIIGKPENVRLSLFLSLHIYIYIYISLQLHILITHSIYLHTHTHFRTTTHIAQIYLLPQIEIKKEKLFQNKG